MAKFATNASGFMLLLNLIQVKESISGSVVPLAMFLFFLLFVCFNVFLLFVCLFVFLVFVCLYVFFCFLFACMFFCFSSSCLFVYFVEWGQEPPDVS